jgi:hypothetical protein
MLLWASSISVYRRVCAILFWQEDYKLYFLLLNGFTSLFSFPVYT